MPTETRFEGDLDHLIKSGRMLLDAMRYECHGETFKERVVKSLGTDNASKYLDGLPNFKAKYQAWYSECIALIKQVLPDRLKDFLSYYEYPRVRKVITVENYMMRDSLQGFVISSRVDRSAAIPPRTLRLPPRRRPPRHAAARRQAARRFRRPSSRHHGRVYPAIADCGGS